MQFPDYFPDNFTEFLPKNIEHVTEQVYRIMLFGELSNELNFYCSYAIKRIKRRPLKDFEIQKAKPIKDRNVNYVLSDFSTSVYIDKSDVIDLMNNMKNTGNDESYIEPYIVVGTCKKKNGPAQLTDKRIPKDNSHVDWWLYKDAKPSNDFKKEK